MNKTELVTAVSKKLFAENRRKPVRIQKHKFFISDSSGNQAEFVIDRKDKDVAYNTTDVTVILDAILEVIEDQIRSGEDVSIIGFGTLTTHKRAARSTKHPVTGEPVHVEERLVPKFISGSRLTLAARAAELVKKDADSAPKLPDPEYEFGEE